MNKVNLSIKLNTILKELKMNKKEFIAACNEVNPYISKPTILNAINGNSKGLPKLETIDTIIKVCKKSDNEKLKNISYDYLMDEYIDNISKDNISIGKELYLSDTSIKKLKHCFMLADSNIISNFIDFIPSDFWEYQSYMKNICELQRYVNESNALLSKMNTDNIKSLVDLYCNYKMEELNLFKKEKSKNEYKEYLIKTLNFQHILESDSSIEELEENLIGVYRGFSVDLRDTFEKYLKNGKLDSKDSENYENKELQGFKKYLEKNYKKDKENIDNSYIETIRKVSKSYVSAYLLEFLRTNFQTQHKFIKDKRKLYDKILLYTDNSISVPLELYKEIIQFFKEYYNSLEIFNKYLRLTISESLSIYYNTLQIKEI